MNKKIKNWMKDHNSELIIFSAGLVVGGAFGAVEVKRVKEGMRLSHLITHHDELGIVREITAFHKNGLTRSFMERTPVPQ